MHLLDFHKSIIFTLLKTGKLWRILMEIQVNGYNIRYKISGDGPKNAVILQGWGTTMEVYDSIKNILVDKYKVIQMDLPGFGSSDEPTEPWGAKEYSDFTLDFLHSIGVEEAVFIGHSYGGRIIINLASREDISIIMTKLLLIDSAGILPTKTKKQERAVKSYKFKKKFLHLSFVYYFFPEMIDEWMNDQGSDDYKAASPMMKKCLVKSVNEDQTDKLSHIKQETLLIWGDLDTATPISDAHIMENKIPDSGLVILEGTGHYSFLEKPVVFKNVISNFLLG